jgi:hypothetical protein
MAAKLEVECVTSFASETVYRVGIAASAANIEGRSARLPILAQIWTLRMLGSEFSLRNHRSPILV